MKKIATLIIALITTSFVVGCDNGSSDPSIIPSSDLNIYQGQSVNNNNYTYTMGSYTYHEYEDHRLEMDFSLSITNITNNESSFVIKDAKAYGNDSLLVEQVLLM